MSDYEDTKVSKLVIHVITQDKYQELVDSGQLDDNAIYMTDKNPSYTPPLLSTLWSDHLLNDISWLRADTFSWQSGDVYVSAYNHLVNCMADATEETETIDGIEITYHLAQNKRKICLPDQEDKLLELYNKTGVAWYYILDEDNTQFKLPRTKYGFTGLRDSVGGYVPESLPNIRSESSSTNVFKGSGGSFTGAFVMRDGPNEGIYGSGGGTYFGVDFDASLSSPTYQDNAPVQERATQMYLYFYVGNFERDAVEQTAGVTAEMFNGKADTNLANTTSNVDFVIESQLPTAENGYTWYRKYKSGWVEQGQLEVGTASGGVITMPVVMADTNYFVSIIYDRGTSTTASSASVGVNSKTTTTFKWVHGGGAYSWQVSGMSAQ